MTLEFGPLEPLHPDDVRYLVVHSAGAPNNADMSAAELHSFHRAAPENGGRGWPGIGYHYVIRRNGQVEQGRPLDTIGAHVRGANAMSVGICCSGNGDLEPFSPAQTQSLVRVLLELRAIFADTVVVGHRELVDLLIAQEKLPSSEATDKTCPGRLVDMSGVRQLVG